MPSLVRFASLTLVLMAASHGTAFAQAAGPATAGGTLPYISSPAEVPASKQQSTSTPDAAPTPDVADKGPKVEPPDANSPVKRLIDPDQIAKQKKTAPAPQPAPVPATAPAPTPAPAPSAPVEAKVPAAPAEAKVPAAPIEAKVPSVPEAPAAAAQPTTAPADKPATTTAETPQPPAPQIDTQQPQQQPRIATPDAPPTAQPDQQATTPPPVEPPAKEAKTKPPVKQKTAKTTRPDDAMAHERPVTDAYYYKGRPRRYVEEGPVPPAGIPAPRQRLYADGDETIYVRRSRPAPVCRTYIVHDFIFTRQVVRCF